jgi:hypothetical protein
VDAEAQIRGAPAVPEAEAEGFFGPGVDALAVRVGDRAAAGRVRRDRATVQCRQFERHDVRPGGSGPAPGDAELAREHGIPETQVTNDLAFARKRFRRHVLDALAELGGSDDEFAAGAREVLAFRP